MTGIIGKSIIGAISMAVIGTGALGIHEKIKPSDLGGKLTWNGETVLSTSSDVHNEEWKRIVKLYEGNDNNNKIEQLDLQDSTNDNPKVEDNIKKLKGKCGSLLKTSIDSSDFESKEKLAKNWCIKGAAGNKTQLQ